MRARVEYSGDLRFSAGTGEKRFHMDGSPDSGGLGEWPSPKEMVLHGLAGCTGMDVAYMLERQGIPFSDFTVTVEAEQTKAHPRVFKRIHIRYEMRAPGDEKRKIERAIELSEQRFCGVSAMLAKSARITWELSLLQEQDS